MRGLRCGVPRASLPIAIALIIPACARSPVTPAVPLVIAAPAVPASIDNPSCAVLSSLFPPIAATDATARADGDIAIDGMPGTALYLDDRYNLASGFVGTTPWRGVITGTHDMIARKAGYQSTTIAITPTTPRPFQTTLDLAHDGDGAASWLLLSSNVASAELYVDDPDGAAGPIGHLPLALPLSAGKHQLRVTAPGFTTLVLPIDLAFLERSERCIRLAPRLAPR